MLSSGTKSMGRFWRVTVRGANAEVVDPGGWNAPVMLTVGEVLGEAELDPGAIAANVQLVHRQVGDPARGLR